jgi:hypothetical protein
MLVVAVNIELPNASVWAPTANAGPGVCSVFLLS